MEQIENIGHTSSVQVGTKVPSRVQILRVQLKKHRSQQVYSEHQNILFQQQQKERNLSRKELIDYRIELWRGHNGFDSSQTRSHIPSMPYFWGHQSEESVSDIDSEYIIKCQPVKKPKREKQTVYEKPRDELCKKQ